MKEQALWLYRQFTRNNRAALLQDLKEQSEVPIAVLFYHRVADDYPNGWTISRDNFARHLDWLQENFELIPLDEVQDRIRSGNERPCVAITFDDGYADNAKFAIPELHRRDIEATYFVATDYTESQAAFPHDAKLGLELRPDSLDELKFYLELGMRIGAHTRSHCDCGQLKSETEIHHEIVGSAQQLESWLKTPIEYFAFPFGLPENTTQKAVDCLKQEGFQGFCSAYGAWNWPATRQGIARNEAFHIRRIHADPGLERLKNWLTLDSRKLTETVSLPFSVSESRETTSA